MSAETLRKAAEKLRESAWAATPGPWQGDGPFYVDPPGVEPSEMTVELRGGVTAGPERKLIMAGQWETRNEDATYIAMMHPRVGYALAGVFERWAFLGDLDPDLLNRIGGEETIAVARLILGDES